MAISSRPAESKGTPPPRTSAAGVPAGRPSSGYLPQLDGLRGVAIVLVLIHHAIVPLPFGGLVGVDIFFALSGYLITGILLREREKYGTIRLRRFYARRFLRLYPPLLVAVAVIAIPGLVIVPSTLRFAADSLMALTYTTPIVVLFVHGVSSVWRQTWSLGMEELFYLIWPALILLWFRARRWRAGLLATAIGLGIVFLGAVVAVGVSGAAIPYILRAGGLFLGCALAIVSQRRPLRAPWPVAFAGLVLIGVGVVFATGGVAGQAAGIVLATVGTLGVLAHFGGHGASVGRIVKAFSWRPLVLLGVVSYEVYLWHYPVFVLAHQVTGTTFITVAWFALPVSFALAIATHVLLARVIDRWKARLPY